MPECMRDVFITAEQQNVTKPVACRSRVVDCVWNVMAHAQKPNFFFRRNGRVHLNRRGRQFSPLLAAELCASAVVMLDTPCSEVVWRVPATHCIRHFPLHFPSRASQCAVTFQLDSTDCLRKFTPTARTAKKAQDGGEYKNYCSCLEQNSSYPVINYPDS